LSGNVFAIVARGRKRSLNTVEPVNVSSAVIAAVETFFSDRAARACDASTVRGA